MISYFQKIRKQLSGENKPVKYFRYAIGEIILVVIGILIALQANNWNENRKQKAQFKVTLEQLYSAMTYDALKFDEHINITAGQIETIDYFLNNRDSYPTVENYSIFNKNTNLKEIPNVLNFVATDFSTAIISDTKQIVSNLNYNANNKSQNEIFKYILNYTNEFNNQNGSFKDYLKPLYLANNIAMPESRIYSGVDSSRITDSLYYTKNDYFNMVKLIHSAEFITALKYTKNDLLYYKIFLKNRLSNVKSILNVIKNYYPKVKILYQDVGIIGTSLDGFDDVGGKSTPLILSDIENDIWEIDLYLKKGQVKFRCRDSWAQNWGNAEFPNGIGILDGDNIIVNEAGNYHIIFKPITGEYKFIKQTK
tara:strand:+ start:1588 stop:2685 length:1098 start_codon:yes stop_codon:yes gene_type:complete